MFNCKELQVLISGEQKIDIQDLFSKLELNGYTHESYTILYLY